MLYTLRTECPVKWTATQEKSICQDYPWPERMSGTAAEYVTRTYLQFLWLPESIMPLDKMALALSRVPSLFPYEFASTSSDRPRAHPLHELLKPCLLTTRSCTDKWGSDIPKLLASEESGDTPEDEMMWFSLRYEKSEESSEDQEQDDVGDTWRTNWLRRMEQREVMIQILLLFLLLSLPGSPDLVAMTAVEASIGAPPSSPQKRKRLDTERHLPPLEDRLEDFMDKLSMWQLMGSIDDAVGGDESLRQARLNTQSNGGEVSADERDWMQKFCEDTVKPLFMQRLPEQCALLHSKVFPSSPFSEDSDSTSPPTSPKTKAKRLRASSTATSHPQNTAAKRSQGLSRTNSLSVSLQEERVRERSKSLSVGPGSMRRRAVTREVSMTTGFKGKTKPAASTRREKERRVGAEQPKHTTQKAKDQGITLVEATPVKPKQNRGVFQPKGRGVLPSMLQNSRMMGSLAVEGDEDDDEWTVDSSPDILLLKPGQDDRESRSWQATPTKKPRARRDR